MRLELGAGQLGNTHPFFVSHRVIEEEIKSDDDTHDGQASPVVKQAPVLRFLPTFCNREDMCQLQQKIAH